MALAYCAIIVILSAVAVGIGFLLTMCVPSLQLGHAIVAGAVIASAALYFFRRLMSAATNYQDDVDGIPEDHPVIVLPKEFLNRRQPRSKSKRKRK